MDPFAYYVWMNWAWATRPGDDGRQSGSEGFAAHKVTAVPRLGRAASAPKGDSPMQADLRQRLQTLAQTPLLLAACGYDGILAEIAPHPADAMPDAAALAALRTLAGAPRTRTAIVSGRTISDLLGFLGAAGPEFLVGSHGAEWGSAGVSLSFDQRHLLGTVAIMLASISDSDPSLICEVNAAGVALHVGAAERSVADAAVAAAVKLVGALPGVAVRRGHGTVEFIVVQANKGDALRRLRRETGATGVVFIGDDLDDEDVFSTLMPQDVGVRVGPGRTSATHQVAGTTEVAAVLAEITSLRRAVDQSMLGGSDRP